MDFKIGLERKKLMNINNKIYKKFKANINQMRLTFGRIRNKNVLQEWL